MQLVGYALKTEQLRTSSVICVLKHVKLKNNIYMKIFNFAQALNCRVLTNMLLSYLSMFLLFALRKATMPSFARASRENGSIPYTRGQKINNMLETSIYITYVNLNNVKIILIR